LIFFFYLKIKLYKQVADLSKTVADLKEEATHYEALAEKAELLANIMMVRNKVLNMYQ